MSGLPSPPTSKQIARAEAAGADFVSMLLMEQQSLTAVEQFAQWHDRSGSRREPLADSLQRESPTQAKYYRELLPARALQRGEQYAFDVDLDACSGCKACVVACHTLNGLEADETWRRVGVLVDGADDPSIGLAAPRIQHVTTACHHCASPGCLLGCPVNAYEKDPISGIVRHLDDQCIGCKYCTMMCPYDVPQYSNRLGIVRKCDMCRQRLAVGEAPACVQACPNQAIRIAIVSTSAIDARGLVSTAPSSSITRPTTIYRSAGARHQQGMPQDAGIDSPSEPHWPLVGLLVLSQTAVGCLLAECLQPTIGWLSGSMGTAVARSMSLPIVGPVALPIAVQIIAILWLAAAIAIGTLHLGRPLGAWRAALRWRTSWFSREAIAFGVLGGAIGAATGLGILGAIGDGPITLATSMVLAAIGMLTVAISGMIYVATQRSLWNPTRTMVRFFGTALAAAMLAWLPQATDRATMTAAAIGFAVVMIGKLFAESRALIGDSHGRALWHRSNRLIRRSRWSWQWTRSMAGTLSIGLIVAAWASIGSTGMFDGEAGLLPAGPWMWLWSLAVCAWLVGELAERGLYFSSVVVDRMPGTLR
jgi:formate dehydrogenase iron-sulfur subunit